MHLTKKPELIAKSTNKAEIQFRARETERPGGREMVVLCCCHKNIELVFFSVVWSGRKMVWQVLRVWAILYQYQRQCQ